LVFGVGVTLFFIGFNMFEPLLQRFCILVCKGHSKKGAGLGVANTFVIWNGKLEQTCGEDF